MHLKWICAELHHQNSTLELIISHSGNDSFTEQRDSTGSLAAKLIVFIQNEITHHTKWVANLQLCAESQLIFQVIHALSGIRVLHGWVKNVVASQSSVLPPSKLNFTIMCHF